MNWFLLVAGVWLGGFLKDLTLGAFLTLRTRRAYQNQAGRLSDLEDQYLASSFLNGDDEDDEE